MIGWLNGQRKRTPIGLDVGATAVRAAQLSRTGDVATIRHTARRQRSQQPTDGGPVDSPQIDQDVRLCLQQGLFSGRSAVAAVDTPDADFFSLELPPAVLQESTAHSRSVVRWEVERLMGDRAAEVETRHWRLPPTQGPAPNAIAIAVGATLVAATRDACQRSGLRCWCVDAAATALARFGTFLHSWGPQQIWGILDAGHRQSRLVLCLGDTPILVRTAGPGGDAWTQRIADSLSISRHAAEVHKRRHGLALTNAHARNTDGNAKADAVASLELAAMLMGILRTDLNDLAAEIKRSYEYVLSCYPARQAVDLVVSGGGAAMPRFPEFLGGALGIPVRRASSYLADPLCRLRCADAQAERMDEFAVAVGLAIE